MKFLRPFAPDSTLPTSPKHSHSKAVAAYRHVQMNGFSVNPGDTHEVFWFGPTTR